MNRRHLTGQRLIALFIAGCLVLNYPLLSLFSHDGLLGGIPILYLYKTFFHQRIAGGSTAAIGRKPSYNHQLGYLPFAAAFVYFFDQAAII